MTFGYTDWQRTSHVSGNELLNVSVAIPGSTQETFGTVSDAAPYAEMIVSIVPDPASTGYYTLTFQWFADASLTQLVAQSTVTFGPMSNINYRIPVISNYFGVVGGQITNVSDPPFVVTIYGRAVSGPPIDSFASGLPFLYYDQSLTAGQRVYPNANYGYTGPAHISIHHDGDNLWNAFVYYYDAVYKAFNVMISINDDHSVENYESNIYIPPAPIQVQLHNGSSTSQAMRVAIIAAPG